tara:strand:+ start:93 stop:350 length:258 start_codon:yes stop_codon:yes gene_type:complete
MLADLTVRLRLTVTLVCFAVLAIVFVAGCGPRVVLVTEDSPVRTGDDMKGHVYALVDGTWTPSRNRVAVPEGWYLVPPSFVENDQ